MSESRETLDQGHRRLAYLAGKDEPTNQDIIEANKVLLKTRNDIREKVVKTARGYIELYKMYSSRTDEGSTQTETFQKRNNTLNWAVLTSLRDMLTVTLEYEELAKEVEDHVGELDAQSMNVEGDNDQGKAGEEPKAKDSGWGFLLQW